METTVEAGEQMARTTTVASFGPTLLAFAAREAKALSIVLRPARACRAAGAV